MQKNTKRYYCKSCDSVVMHSKVMNKHMCLCCISLETIQPTLFRAFEDPNNGLDSWIPVDVSINDHE